MKKSEEKFQQYVIALKKEYAANNDTPNGWESVHIDETAAREWFNAGKTIKDVMREMQLYSAATYPVRQLITRKAA